MTPTAQGIATAIPPHNKAAGGGEKARQCKEDLGLSLKSELMHSCLFSDAIDTTLALAADLTVRTVVAGGPANSALISQMRLHLLRVLILLPVVALVQLCAND